MLKNLNPLLGPDVLHVLASMGHGDELLVADANFPAATMARRLCYMSVPSTTLAIEAILSVMPLDQYVEAPVAVMAVVGEPDTLTPTEQEFQRTVDRMEGKQVNVARVERFAFYERAREAFAVIATCETRLYGNVFLKKGVVSVPSDDRPA